MLNTINLLKEFDEALSNTSVNELSDNDISSILKLSNTIPVVLNEIDITRLNLETVLRHEEVEKFRNQFNELTETRKQYINVLEKIEPLLNQVFKNRGENVE